MVITISCLGNKELYCSGPRILAPNNRSVKKAHSPTFGLITKVSHWAAGGKEQECKI